MTAVQRKLAHTGQRTTPQRLQILSALLAEDHPAAETVWERVRGTSPTTTLATVYKTLETLKKMGEVMEVETRDQRRHYDALHPEPHPHAVCSGCGRIDDVTLTGIGDLQSQAMQASGYQIQDHSLTFYGLCRTCQETARTQNEE